MVRRYVNRLLRFRLRTLLVVLAAGPIVVAIFSADFLSEPLRESDKEESARTVIAWIVEAKEIPGHKAPYPDSEIVSKKAAFLVQCDFVRASTSLSDDHRVRRVSQDEYERALKTQGFDQVDYITIRLKGESTRVLVVEVTNYYGTLAGHGYNFEFRRKWWKLRASGKLLWST